MNRYRSIEQRTVSSHNRCGTCLSCDVVWCRKLAELFLSKAEQNQLDRSRENWSFHRFLEYLSLQVSSNGKGSTTGDFHFSLFAGHFQEASIVLHKEIVYDILSSWLKWTSVGSVPGRAWVIMTVVLLWRIYMCQWYLEQPSSVECKNYWFFV